jgi:hypothetical protein
MNELEKVKLLYQLYLLKYNSEFSYDDMNESIDIQKIYRKIKNETRIKKLNKINKNNNID